MNSNLPQSGKLYPQWKKKTTYAKNMNILHKKSKNTNPSELREKRMRIYDNLDERFTPIFTFADYQRFLTDTKYTLEKHIEEKQKLECKKNEKTEKQVKEVYIYHTDGTKSLFMRYVPITEAEYELQQAEYEYMEPIEYYECDENNLPIQDDTWEEILSNPESDVGEFTDM